MFASIYNGHCVQSIGLSGQNLACLGDQSLVTGPKLSRHLRSRASRRFIGELYFYFSHWIMNRNGLPQVQTVSRQFSLPKREGRGVPRHSEVTAGEERIARIKGAYDSSCGLFSIGLNTQIFFQNLLVKFFTMRQITGSLAPLWPCKRVHWCRYKEL
jgi:hypothetical protein